MRKVTTEKTAAEKLKDAAAFLFSEYGFEGTSVRMIASKAGYSAGLVTKLFGSKENLYHQIIKDIYEGVGQDYDGIIAEFRECEEHGGCSQEKAWELIERLIDVQMAFAFDVESRHKIKIVDVHPLNVNEDPTRELIQVTKEKIEGFMAEVLRVVFRQKRWLHVYTVSRAIHGCTMGFVSNPELLLDDVINSRYMPSSEEWMKTYLKNYLMDSLRTEARRE